VRFGAARSRVWQVTSIDPAVRVTRALHADDALPVPSMACVQGAGLPILLPG
jgi:hypothetical protein